MSPAEVIDTMYTNDAFSKWLGIEVIEQSPGACKLSMCLREEMTNGFKIAHGGVTYSLADTALAFASNSYGIQSMSIETSISHLKTVNIGDKLIAEAKEISKSNKIGVYAITITNGEGVKVAHFKGTVYRTGKEWKEEKSKKQNE